MNEGCAMNKIVRRTAVSLALLTVGLAIAAGGLYARGGARLARSYDVRVAPIRIPSTADAIERGRHLSEAVALCAACHGDDLSGAVLFEAPGIATVYAPNLTPGRGGSGGAYTDADFVRAIRHGVNREGRGMLIMHADAYHALGEDDLGAIVAYLKSLAPVDKETPDVHVTPMGRVMLALGLFDSDVMPLIPAETIDHAAPLPQAPLRGATPEYGGYLTRIALCSMCHGAELRGGPPIEEGAPPAPDIALYAKSALWSEQQFVATLRTGTTPYGKRLDPEVMPWEVYARMSEEELVAIWRYMASSTDG
jgi:mono/diheme cytochrome c family protein